MGSPGELVAWSSCISPAMGFIVYLQVILGTVIGSIVGAFVPIVSELTWWFATAKPPESHVKWLDSLDDDSFIAHPNCSSQVVGLDGRCWLLPIHFHKHLVEWDHFFGCDEEGVKFWFCCGRRDKLDDLGYGEDWAVKSWERVIFWKEDMSSSATESSGFVEEGSCRWRKKGYCCLGA